MNLPPRTNHALLGHETTETMLTDAVAAGRLPHGLILSGEAGIGKATLAYRFARYLLSPQFRVARSLAVSPEAPSVRRIASGAHGDLIVIERHIDPVTGKQAKEIAVEDVRKIAPFLRMTAAEGGWRVAIVDDASTLNRAGQNALLKILEEPPPRTVLILVSDRPGLLLPTIHSRCRLIRMPPLGQAIVLNLLEDYAPDLDSEQRLAIAELAEGSIGRALRLVENEGLPLYQEMLALLRGLPDPDWQGVHGFADRLASPTAEPSYRLFAEFLPAWIARLVKNPASETLAGLAPPGRWLDACAAITQRFGATDAANLDRRLTVWSAFETLARVKAA